MDKFDDDTLLAELRELRPTPRPEFTAELDERAAAGFPRRPSRAGAAPVAKLADHLRDLRAMTARQWLVPVVGMAIAVLATAGVVVAFSKSGGRGSEKTTSDLAMSESSGGAATSAEAEDTSEGAEAGGEEPAEAGGRTVRPFSKVAPALKSSKSAEKAPAAAAPAHGAESSEEAAPEEEASVEKAPRNGFAPAAGGGGAAAHGHRDVERSASVVLGTKPGEVAAAASKVYAAVHAANGVVLSSSVESGTTGATGASFSLLIPSGKVDDALASFSQIAEVRSRHDTTNDITGPTVTVTEELRDSNASIEGLLKELGDVETEAERESVEARLHEERRRHASIRASLENLHKRASMSEVSVRIVTNHGAGVVPPSKGNGGWSVSDALHDAGHILTVAAGVLLIALAILAPIALIALLIWSLNRFRVRRLRERTLG